MELINSERDREQRTKGKKKLTLPQDIPLSCSKTALHWSVAQKRPAEHWPHAKHCSRRWDHGGEQEVPASHGWCPNREAPKQQFLGSTHFFNPKPNPSPSKGSQTYSVRVIFQFIRIKHRIVLCTGAGHRIWGQDAWFHILALLFRWERPWASHSTSLLPVPHLKMELIVLPQRIFIGIKKLICLSI